MTAPPERVRLEGRTREGLHDALRAQGIHLNRGAEELFADARFRPATETREWVIRALSVEDLGFASGATFPQLLDAAAARGLAPAPLELAAYLRMQFMDQAPAPPDPPGKERRAPSGSLTVVSHPLDAGGAGPRGFYLRHADGVLWLRGYWADDAHVWSPGDRLVFVLRER